MGVEAPAIDKLRTTVRISFAAVAGAAMAWWLLAGLAWVIERDRPNPAVQAAKQRQAARAHQGKRARRLTAVVLHRPKANKTTQLVAAAKKKKKKPKPVEKLDGQVVETARPEREERAAVAKYLGRWDMKVEREQKSRGQKRKSQQLGKVRIDKPSRLQSPDSKSKAPTRIASRQQRRKKRVPKGNKLKSTKAEAKSPGEGALAKAGVAKDGPGIRRGGGQDKPTPKQPSVIRGAHSDMLLPATSPGNILHNIQALAGSPGSDDYLPQVLDEGDTNLLNTRKFRYWDFFQRVKDRVRSEWNPASVWRSRDPTGKRYGVRDRLTVVRVTLDPDGALKAIRVAQRSGLPFLDDEARRAFTAAGPYPNPPRGLMNGQGVVEFKFGFMFEISSARFRFYRMGQ